MTTQNLGHVANALIELSQTNFKVGPILDQLVKVVIKYFTSLDGLVKYFCVRVKNFKECVRHSQLRALHKTVKNLSDNIYKIITHLDVSQSIKKETRKFFKLFCYYYRNIN